MRDVSLRYSLSWEVKVLIFHWKTGDLRGVRERERTIAALGLEVKPQNSKRWGFSRVLRSYCVLFRATYGFRPPVDRKVLRIGFGPQKTSESQDKCNLDSAHGFVQSHDSSIGSSS